MPDDLDPIHLPSGDDAEAAKQREKFVHAVVEAGAFAGVFLAVARFAPHPAAKVAAFFIGFEIGRGETSATATGSPRGPGLRPGPTAPLNFAPYPIGFLDPSAVGLKRNYYLPSGSSRVIPPFVDRIGMGLPEQRAEDATNAANAAVSRAVKAAKVVESESTDTLLDIAEGKAGFRRSGVLFATSEVGFDELQRAAQREVAIRSGPGAVAALLGAIPDSGQPAVIFPLVPPPIAFPVPQTVGAQSVFDLDGRAATIATASSATDPFGGRVAMSSIQPEAIKPVNDAAHRNQDAARGINRELVAERADP